MPPPGSMHLQPTDDHFIMRVVRDDHSVYEWHVDPKTMVRLAHDVLRTEAAMARPALSFAQHVGLCVNALIALLLSWAAFATALVPVGWMFYTWSVSATLVALSVVGFVAMIFTDNLLRYCLCELPWWPRTLGPPGTGVMKGLDE